MKQKIKVTLFLILLGIIVFLLTSCGTSPQTKMQYTYDLVYTDGTSETVTTNNKIEFQSKTDCITTAGCGCKSPKQKWCGIRKFDLLSTDVLGNPNKKSYKPDVEFDISDF